MKECNCIVPSDAGWINVELDDTEMDFLWKSIENRGEDKKHELAGNIDSSYKIFDKDNWFYNNTLVRLCEAYSNTFKNVGDRLPTRDKHPYYLDTMWVNYQKQTEFNPVHDHKGVYSFVIWMKIPTEYDEQKENPIAKTTNSSCISNFCFNYINMLGENEFYYYEMSKKMEGKMVFFPSKLTHVVYPFYNCSEYRISISGNICLDTTRIYE